MADDEVAEYRLHPLGRALMLFGAVDRVRLHPDALEASSRHGTKRIVFTPDTQIRLHMPLLPHHTRPGMRRMLRVSDGTTTIQAGLSLHGFYQLAVRLLEVEAKYVTPSALARYARGERLTFGAITVQGDTITFKGKTMKRAELTGPLLAHGEIKFHAPDRVWPVLSLPDSEIPNFVTLTKVLDAQRARLAQSTRVTLRPSFSKEQYTHAAVRAGATLVAGLIILARILLGSGNWYDSKLGTLIALAMVLAFVGVTSWPVLRARAAVHRMQHLARYGRLTRVRVIDVQNKVQQAGNVTWKVRYRTPRGQEAKQTFFSGDGGPYVLSDDENELLALTSVDERESLVLRTDAYPLLAPPSADELARLRG